MGVHLAEGKGDSEEALKLQEEEDCPRDQDGHYVCPSVCWGC